MAEFEGGGTPEIFLRHIIPISGIVRPGSPGVRSPKSGERYPGLREGLPSAKFAGGVGEVAAAQV